MEKARLIESYAALFGEYAAPITAKDQQSNFNGIKARKLFIYCDEAVWSHKLELAESINNETTAQQITINEKYGPQYTIRNVCETWFTSNRTDSIFLKNRDRRCAAFRAVEEKLCPEKAKAYREWFEGEGKQYVMHFLMTRDISKFNPHADAPLNEFKKELIEDSMNEWQSRVAELAEDCEGKPLRRLDDIVGFDVQNPKKAKRIIARELRTAGAKREKIKLKHANGNISNASKQIELWCVADYAKWSATSQDKWREQYERQQKNQPEDDEERAY